MDKNGTVMVTGATGYIGGRLIPNLLEAGWRVRCLTRNPAKLDSLPWRDQIEVVEADLLESDSLPEALDGCDMAFYLVHSMEEASTSFVDRDRRAARNFADAAERSRVKRIVYLGGLGNGDLSDHLASRQEVGRVLASTSVPVTELRAAVIIGSGSVSFEMLRYLTEVLPAMITPRWVKTRCQPIAVRDVLEILVASLDDEGPSVIREIGGPDQITYEQMMRIYAEAAGLPKRWIVPVPVLSPKLSSHWIGLVTPLPTGVAKPLVDSLRNEVTVSDNSYAQRKAGPLLDYRTSVERALSRSKDLEVATRWSGSTTSPAQALPGDPSWSGGTVLVDEQRVESAATRSDLFWAFSRIGGTVGYYTMDWAWNIRGVFDSMFGGVGLRRGRRHPEQLRLGESLDFWRVVKVVPDETLHLYAEMKLPGDAWLTYELDESSGSNILVQKAVFIPRGLLGRVYWWAMLPFHAAIFSRMANRIVSAAEGRPTPVL